MKHFVFHDTEELSQTLQHTDVSSMQINKGRYHGELSQYALEGWSIQHVKFNEGRAVCRGSSPKERHALLIPLSLSADFRLLGREVTETSFGYYAPKSEHGDTTAAGASEVVLVPPPDLIEQIEHDVGLKPTRRGSYHQDAPAEILDALRGTLAELHQMATTETPLLDQADITRRFAERLQEHIYELLPNVDSHGARGRPQLPRSAILQKLNQRLDEITDQPIYAMDLCAEFGISFPTLRRICIDWYGVPPAKYLQLHRYYLARRLLKKPGCTSVTSVAHACGFWDASRFSLSYRSLFNESPSTTLRNTAAKRRQAD